jgi:hypothetical protein
MPKTLSIMTLSIPISKNDTQYYYNHHSNMKTRYSASFCTEYRYAVAYAVYRTFNVTLNVPMLSVFFVLLIVIILIVIFSYCHLLTSLCRVSHFYQYILK